MIARGLSAPDLLKHVKRIRKAAEQYKDEITLLAGSEVDILADGRLDYEDTVLAELDIVIASPHAALTQAGDKATGRLLRAIDNRYVTVIGHPTGRLIAGGHAGLHEADGDQANPDDCADGKHLVVHRRSPCY